MSTTECRLKHTGSETFYGVLSLLSFATEIRNKCVIHAKILAGILEGVIVTQFTMVLNCFNGFTKPIEAR